MVGKQRTAEREYMKIKQIISLIIGITSVALSPITWAAGHGGGGGGGGFGGGGHFGGGGGAHFAGGGGGRGGGHFAGGRGFRGGGAGFRPAGPRFTGGRPGVSNAAARQSRTFERSGFNRRIANHVAERHDPSWHRDWDRRHAHFDHHRFFVFIDGFWCGLDDGFFPWDYYPYYGYDYYPYDYYTEGGPYDNTDPGYNGVTVVDPTVQASQMELSQLGYYNGPIDGIYGRLTRDAVAKYQIANQLDVTGSLSPDTLQSLGLPQPTVS